GRARYAGSLPLPTGATRATGDGRSECVLHRALPRARPAAGAAADPDLGSGHRPRPPGPRHPLGRGGRGRVHGRPGGGPARQAFRARYLSAWPGRRHSASRRSRTFSTATATTEKTTITETPAR